jgi:lambda family phage minor tail protein L
MSVSDQVLQEHVGAYVELYDIMVEDRTGNSADNLYLTTSVHWDSGTGAYTGIVWKGNNYLQVPVMSSGYTAGTSGTQGQPSFKVSNLVHTLLIPLMAQTDNLLGVRLVRWRTFLNLINEGGQPFISRQELVINELTNMNAEEISWKLANKLDRDAVTLPLRQVLRESHTHNGVTYEFPGVARQGVRSR